MSSVHTLSASVQVAVETTPARVSPSFIEQLDARLLLLFTGKPRLAKNLLQNVIRWGQGRWPHRNVNTLPPFRNWYSQDPVIVNCFQSNYRLAERCWARVEAEDVSGVGECLAEYWGLKRTLAPGSEPALVRTILDTLEVAVWSRAVNEQSAKFSQSRRRPRECILLVESAF